MTLYLEAGGEILATNDTSLWPIIPPLPSYGQGRDHIGPRYTSLIHGENLTDVAISGENGTINGNGELWWKLHREKKEIYTRGHLIEFMGSE